MKWTFRIIARNELSTKKKKVFHKCKYLFLYQPRLALVLGIFSFRNDRFLNVKVPRGFFTKQASQRRRVAVLLPISHRRFGHYFYSNLYGRAPRDPRCVKKSDFFLQMKLLSSCAKIAPKRHKLQKIIKIEKKYVKIEFFEYSSIWGQSQGTKPQMVCLVDPGASFDTPGVSGGGSIQKISRFQYLFKKNLSCGASYNFFHIIQNKV